MTEIVAALRSFVTTFLATAVALLPVSDLLNSDYDFVPVVLGSALVAALRTTLAALDPGQPLYGVKSRRDVRLAA